MQASSPFLQLGAVVKYSVEQLLSTAPTRWDQRIAADIAAELERQLGEKAETIPEMRQFLAVKGYRELRERLKKDVDGLSGEGAVRQMALTFRAFAHERPGLSAATFRNSATDTPEWRREGELLGQVAIDVFKTAELTGDQALMALRVLRALIRGFVLHEMAASFMDHVDYDETFITAVTMFIRGLDVLRGQAT
jgi:Tetracyclin repressor-like, C-terminal domain